MLVRISIITDRLQGVKILYPEPADRQAVNQMENNQNFRQHKQQAAVRSLRHKNMALFFTGNITAEPNMRNMPRRAAGCFRGLSHSAKGKTDHFSVSYHLYRRYSIIS